MRKKRFVFERAFQVKDLSLTVNSIDNENGSYFPINIWKVSQSVKCFFFILSVSSTLHKISTLMGLVNVY